MADDEIEQEFQKVLAEAQRMARMRGEDLNQGQIRPWLGRGQTDDDL